MGYKSYVLVCGGASCGSKTSADLYRSLVREVDARNLSSEVQVVQTGCFGFCERGPIVKILPEEILYVDVQPSDASELVGEHIVNRRPVARLRYHADESKRLARVDDVDFYQKQFRVVLRNCGTIDPEDVGEYVARDGYSALERVLYEMTPDRVIAELKASGLRGRGGAGFPTWMKWTFTRQVDDAPKYVVCNADEGDPGAYMDRSVLEGDPHSVIEAMTIGGHTVGAHQGFIYIRAEYPLAIRRLEVAIRQAKDLGFLGKDILGSGFDFDIELRLGAGAFVCGEETALFASIEGERGMPKPRPPFPAVKGLWRKPTVINNVETWANVPVVINRGADWFSRIGTDKSKGTKVFALTGKINNSGLVEVPMGTPLRDIIYNIGGGIPNGKKFKAVQTGGPSGGMITADYIDTPIDYEHLQELGTIMGSGGMIVMDEDDCMVDVAKFYLGFTVDESCGKCAPCRVGGRQLYGILERVSKGTAEEAEFETLKRIGHAMRRASLCGLGQSAPNPVVSGLRFFEAEYLTHVREHRCPSHKCKELVTFSIVSEKCIGCGLCARRCPAGAISGEKRQPHVVDQSACIKCGECFSVCKFDAVSRV